MPRLSDAYQNNRALVWLCAVIFVNQLGFGSVTPVVPLYAKSFGVSISAIGLSVAVYGLARFIGGLPTGQLSDRLGRRPTLVIGEALTCLGNLLCGLATDYPQFLLFRFVAGLGAVAVVTTGQVILADLSTRSNRGKLMGIYQGAFLAGVGLGPLPGGVLAEAFGLSFPFYAFAALGVIAGVVAFDRVPETRGARHEISSMAPASGEPYLRQLWRLLENRGFTLVSLVSFVQFFARTGAIFAVVPVMAATRLGLSADQIGSGLTTTALANMGMVYFAGVMVDRFGRKPVIVPSTLISGLAVASFAFAPGYGSFIAASLFWGIASGISGPAPAAYAADMAPPGLNAVTMSSYRMISDLGYVVGPMLLGWIADMWGNEFSVALTGVAFVVSASLFGLFAPETMEKKMLSG